MLYALDEINADQLLLPNIRLVIKEKNSPNLVYRLLVLTNILFITPLYTFLAKSAQYKGSKLS